ncbi:ATP-binding cassette domain-containing protein [Amycolatopsis sp. CA-230715]|uniref:ATP-binding cassette domain-containing protein n=1 Tax=Amycolatopsis sp. CA-230715 TaxID=2745196 RepID=UPI001C0202DB|nr:ATP-binding cassette domain-containing protein [Amycolatopsis sp. CA-230715]QWF78104.1 Doxorubicin resistance ATP-binding protein DrrA [Amycolatopsis sp. CA-230715]
MLENDRGPAIAAVGVRKAYPSAGKDDPPALDGFDLEVSRGTVHGLLGPNGAGKTTAVRIMATLLDLDEGTVLIGGDDVARDGGRVRRRIGLVGQYAAVDEELTGLQNLVMFGRLSRLSVRAAKTRAAELLDRFGLADTGTKRVSAYSGGMRRRLDLAAGLLVAPEVLFVDEPTTGLDPAGRREVWTAIRDLVDGGTTVLLTTQYLEEADQLADRVSMLTRGRVVAEGTPAELKAKVGDDWLDLVPRDSTDIARITGVVGTWASGEIHVSDGTVRVPVADRAGALLGAAAALRDAGIGLDDIAIRTPSLDDVFLHLNEKTEGVPV